MDREELKRRRRVLIVRRRHDMVMKNFVELEGGKCGHKDCEAFNAGSHAITRALEWSLEQGVPVEWLTTMISKGLAEAMIQNQLTPADVNGDKAINRQPHEVN